MLNKTAPRILEYIYLLTHLPLDKMQPFRRLYFEMHFYKYKDFFFILIKISLIFFPEGPIDSITTLF